MTRDRRLARALVATGLLAAAILATADAALGVRIAQWRQDQTDGVAEQPE